MMRTMSFYSVLILLGCLVAIPAWAQGLQEGSGDKGDQGVIHGKAFTPKHGADSLAGDWAFSGAGQTSDSEPVTSLASFSFSGEGECECKRTESGPTWHIPWTNAEACVYTVDSDGTGAITITIDGTDIPYSFVMSKIGSELFWIRLDDMTLSGTAKKIADPLDLMKR